MVQAHAVAETFLAACDPDCSGCAILDIGLPDLDGLAVQQALQARGVHIPIIFLTGQGTVPGAVQALQEGAVDFLEKPVITERLLERIRTAMRENVRQQVQEQEQLKLEQLVGRLTPREKDVLLCVSKGLSNKEIARDLDISFRTVEGYRQRVRDKLRVDTLAELIDIVRRCELE